LPCRGDEEDDRRGAQADEHLQRHFQTLGEVSEAEMPELLGHG
jgi:hypothetical protein